MVFLSKTHQFDYLNFIKYQYNIFKKWEDIKDYQNYNSKELINNLDKYILHTIEEIIESKEELDGINFDNFTNEMCDIVLYLGTVSSILYALINIKTEIKDEYSLSLYLTEKYNDNLEKSLNLYLLNYENNHLYDIILLKAVENLINVRRLWPERKWHKKYKEPSQEELLERLVENFKQIINTIELIISSLILIKSPEDINKNLIAKHNYILNLVSK